MAQPHLVSRAGCITDNLRRRLTKATVHQYQAAYEQTVATYRQTVLVAFQQVEDDLASLRILSQVSEKQDSAAQSSRRSFREADVQHRACLDPYLDVIVSQATLLDAQQVAITFRMQRMVANIQLIAALGGGWKTSKMTSTKEPGAKTP